MGSTKQSDHNTEVLALILPLVAGVLDESSLLSLPYFTQVESSSCIHSKKSTVGGGQECHKELVLEKDATDCR